MRVGALLMPTDPWDETVRRVQDLEAMGFDHLWVYDHLSWRRYRDRPWHATIPWLTGLAAATRSIRFGTMVANPNIRHPLLLAKDFMTLDHVSDGRVTLGVGAGGTGYDATVLGAEALTPGQRIARLSEYLQLLDGLLAGTLANFRGDWYAVDEARMHPGCVQRPRLPIAVGAGGSKGLELVARFGDAWITYGDTSYRDVTAAGTEAIVARQSAALARHCGALDRDPAGIDRIYLIGNTEARPLASVDEFVDFVGRYRSLGFTDIVFHHPRPDDPVWNEPEVIVERIAEALPQLRS